MSISSSTELLRPSDKLSRNQPNPKQAADQLTCTTIGHGPETGIETTIMIGKMTMIVMMTTGATTTIDAITTIVGEMTIVAVITITGMKTTITMMTMIGTMTIFVMIIVTTSTTPTGGSPETTKGSTDSKSTGRKMCVRIDEDHPTTTDKGHATHGPTHHGHKSSTSDN